MNPAAFIQAPNVDLGMRDVGSEAGDRFFKSFDRFYNLRRQKQRDDLFEVQLMSKLNQEQQVFPLAMEEARLNSKAASLSFKEAERDFGRENEYLDYIDKGGDPANFRGNSGTSGLGEYEKYLKGLGDFGQQSTTTDQVILDEINEGQPTMKARPADKIIGYEARRDKQGRLIPYNLPSGDGGGAFEVAGINERYHPVKARQLKDLIASGRHDEAEQEAARYIEEYTSAIPATTNPGLELALRDAAFNRGPTGSAKITQIALGLPVTGKWDDTTKSALSQAESDPKDFLVRFRKARETYEQNNVGRGPGNKFWNGLVNRWDKQLKDSLSLT